MFYLIMKNYLNIFRYSRWLGGSYFRIFFWFRNISDIFEYLFLAILSSVTLFEEHEIEELLSMPGDKRLLSLGVKHLGVPGVFGVLGFLTLGLLVNFLLGSLVKLSFELLMDSCSLYSSQIHLDLNLSFNQDYSLSLTQLFSLKQKPWPWPWPWTFTWLELDLVWPLL